MSLPPQPPSPIPVAIEGDVQVHPTAVIASEVVLYAEPGSQIRINAGVCIGMGSILHAYTGCIEVAEGANLGTGVLIVGQGTIGSNSCIGSATTLINCDLEPETVLAAGTLIGDTSRQVKDFGQEPEPQSQSSNFEPQEPPPPQDQAQAESVQSLAKPKTTTPTVTNPFVAVSPVLPSVAAPPLTNPSLPDSPVTNPTTAPLVAGNGFVDPSFVDPTSSPDKAEPESIGSRVPPEAESAIVNGQPKSVYGQDYVQRMMGRMFPHRTQPINHAQPDRPPEEHS